MVNEKLLQFIWNSSLLDTSKLKTTQGESITVVDKGLHNLDAGPDFLNARVKIGNELWAGNIEIHVHAKDWFAHRHQHDPKYENVVLHVVMFNDSDLNIPTIELNGKISNLMIAKYDELMQSSKWIACEDIGMRLQDFEMFQFKNRLVIERLERKLEKVKDDLDETNNDWEECHYRNLLRVFGLKVNLAGFTELGRVLPFKILRKHRGDNKLTEALLFGCAGMLNEPIDEYQKSLKTEFDFYQKKYRLSSLHPVIWNYATLRPANFPSVRLAQLASIINKEKMAFAEIVDIPTAAEAIKYFSATANSYWNNHYQFGKESKQQRAKQLGKSTLDLLFINHTLPMIYALGWFTDKGLLKEKSIDWLEKCKPEQNQIISKWFNLGYEMDTALDTQAHLQLKNEYCNHKKCLSCAIGNRILRNYSLGNEN